MKYVRMKSGEINILADGDSIPAGAETIFSTDPSVYEGTWDKPTSGLGRVDVEMAGGKERSVVSLAGDKERDTSYVGTAKERKKTSYDPEGKLGRDMQRTGWTEPTKAHPKDKICLECGKIMVDARPNKKFCCDKCRDAHKKRASRAKASAIKKFVPHRGKEGQIYFIQNGQIEFVPALWADTEKRATKYIKERYEGNEQVEILKQVKEVIGK